MKKPILLSLLMLPLFVACGKQEPPAPAAPPAPQSAPLTPAAPAPEAAAPAPAPATPAAGGNTAKGEDIYKQTCFACHAAGVAGAHPWSTPVSTPARTPVRTPVRNHREEPP